MPLPDERPRQSVANLIGRFEKQKASSNGPPAPLPVFQRTSSVASHRTGDSAVEELKEKREWPPKRTDATTVTPPMPNPEKEPIVDPPSVSIPNEKEPEVVEAPPEPSPIPLPPPDPTSAPSMPPKAKPTTSTPNKSSTPRTPAVAKPSTLKSSTKPASVISQKSLTNTTSATPLKPQTTGQSVSSTRTPAPKSATPARHTATVTPARVKTPTAKPPTVKTPTARAKSPNVRPKTPSSGLYAPTAASLARSKNAPAPPPSEKPKRKITTDLSKPTAASASKVRASVPVTSPPKVTKTPRPSTSRPLTGTGKSTTPAIGVTKSATKAPTMTAKNGNANVTSVSKTKVPTTAVGQHVSEEHKVAEEAVSEEVSPVENLHIESYDDDFADDTHVGPEEHAGETQEEFASELHPEEHVENTVDEAHSTSRAEEAEDNTTHHEEVDANGDVGSEPPVDVVENARTDEEENNLRTDITEGETVHVSATSKPVGDDLDDLVNMLETVPPIHRPNLESTATRSVSDTGEIPDEY